MPDESMAHAMHGMQVRKEISEKKKRVYHLRRRNIEISEKTKHVEDLGHNARTDTVNLERIASVIFNDFTSTML